MRVFNPKVGLVGQASTSHPEAENLSHHPETLNAPNPTSHNETWNLAHGLSNKGTDPELPKKSVSEV